MARSSSRETAKPHNVFLSWSGKRSFYVAQFFYGWLQKVLQRAKPWFSDRDIDKGTVGVDEIQKALSGMQVGIFFLTPENRESVWMPYEAGSLANEVNDKTRICTYLLGGLQIQHVRGPFGMFQHTRPDCEETRKLVHTINRVLDGEVLSDAIVDSVFDKWWPELSSHLDKMPQAEGDSKPLPKPEEMIAEILELSRAAANRGKQNEWMDKFNEDAKDVLPPLFQVLKGVNLNQLIAPPAPPPPPPPREPKSTFCIKLAGDPEIKRAEGTAGVVMAKGEVIIVAGTEVVARFESVEGWWKESTMTISGELPPSTNG